MCPVLPSPARGVRTVGRIRAIARGAYRRTFSTQGEAMAGIVRRSLGQEATNLLRQMLLDGRFTPGERLGEDRIAAELGISRTPLREALHRLAQEGLLEKRRAGGYQLRELRQEEIEDAIDVRALLESHAASLAARRAGSDALKMLRDNLEAFRDAGEDGNIPRLISLNTEFHAALRRAAASPLLTHLLGELDGVVERMLRANVCLEEAGQWSAVEHADLLRHIEAGDGAGAAEAMRAHVLHGGEKVLEKLRS